MAMSPKLLERVRQEMALRNYAERTIDTYASSLKQFLGAMPCHPREATVELIQAYLLEVVASTQSRAAVDQAISALKFLYIELYGWTAEAFAITRPKRHQTLPYVPTRQEVRTLLDSIENRRYRLAAGMLYGSGLGARGAADRGPAFGGPDAAGRVGQGRADEDDGRGDVARGGAGLDDRGAGTRPPAARALER
jgi:integrase